MEKTCRFTKKNTLAVKGIAISFLLFYHCFSNSARMRNMAVSFVPFSQDTAMMIARCMVHCVGMFAFLSVYGLTLSMKSKYPEYDFDSVFLLYRSYFCDGYVTVCRKSVGKYNQHSYGFLWGGTSLWNTDAGKYMVVPQS